MNNFPILFKFIICIHITPFCIFICPFGIAYISKGFCKFFCYRGGFNHRWDTYCNCGNSEGFIAYFFPLSAYSDFKFFWERMHR